MKSYFYSCHFLRRYHDLRKKKNGKRLHLDYQKNTKQYSNENYEYPHSIAAEHTCNCPGCIYFAKLSLHDLGSLSYSLTMSSVMLSVPL